MGIYISGVKGLPEQVQENKEKIAQIEEDIKDIDFDKIRELEDQVEENTEDINNMEGTIGTQNIAITQLGGRVDTLEPKVEALEDLTQDIERDSEYGVLDVNAQVRFNDSIYVSQDYRNKLYIGEAQDSFISQDGNDNVEISSNGDEYIFKNGTIEVNGTPVGKTYYYHNISFSYSSIYVSLGITSSDNTEINTLALLKTAVEKLSGDPSVIRHKPLMCNLYQQGNPSSYNSGCIYSNGTSLVFCKSGASSWSETVVSSATVADIVVEL